MDEDEEGVVLRVTPLAECFAPLCPPFQLGLFDFFRGPQSSACRHFVLPQHNKQENGRMKMTLESGRMMEKKRPKDFEVRK
jgi:hypothetical protein